MRKNALVLTLIAAMLTVVPAAAQATNPPLADCGLPAQGRIVQSVTYTLNANCTLTGTLEVAADASITVTINGDDHSVTSGAGSFKLLSIRSTSPNPTIPTVNLNRVTFDSGQQGRNGVIHGDAHFHANQATFRGVGGEGAAVFFGIGGNTSSTFTNTLFENNRVAAFGNHVSINSSALLLYGSASATFNNVVLRANYRGAATILLRDTASLTATGCLSFIGNIPQNVTGNWTDNSSGPCSGSIGNGGSIDAPPTASACGLPLGGSLTANATYTLRADCALTSSLVISEGLSITIRGNSYTISGAYIDIAIGSTLTIEDAFLEELRIFNYGTTTLNRISFKITSAVEGIVDLGVLKVSRMLAENNQGEVIFAYNPYGAGNTTIKDSVFRNTSARAGRAALMSFGSGASITLSGCITFENNSPANIVAAQSATVTDNSTGECTLPVGPAPRPDPTPEPDDDDDNDDDDDDDDDDPDPQPSPTPTTTPNVYMPSERSVVYSGNDDLQYEPVDIITLDKHPALQGGRFAVRLWRFSPQCAHRVVADDNLYRLAIQYQETVETLRSLNGIVGDQLSIGQYLLFPSCVRDGSLAFENTRICFEDQGNLVFIDTSMSPPQVSTLEKYPVNGMTCANVDQPGLVVLTALDS